MHRIAFVVALPSRSQPAAAKHLLLFLRVAHPSRPGCGKQPKLRKSRRVGSLYFVGQGLLCPRDAPRIAFSLLFVVIPNPARRCCAMAVRDLLLSLLGAPRSHLERGFSVALCRYRSTPSLGPPSCHSESVRAFDERCEESAVGFRSGVAQSFAPFAKSAAFPGCFCF